MGLVKGSLQRTQLQATRCRWLHEDKLATDMSNPAPLPTRAGVMADITKVVLHDTVLPGLYTLLASLADLPVLLHTSQVNGNALILHLVT